METTLPLRVRVLGLGQDGVAALPSVVRAIRDTWAAQGAVHVEGCVGKDAPRVAAATLRRWCDRDRVDAAFTVGRAGHDRQDFAPEITAALLRRSLPGIEERMYLSAPRDVAGLLFRGRAGLRGGTLLVNLPGDPRRARRVVAFLAPVVRHALEKAHGSGRDCGAGGAR